MKGAIKAIMEKKYKDANIDDNTIKGISQYPRFFRGHVRTSSGKLYKTREFMHRSNKVLSARMP